MQRSFYLSNIPFVLNFLGEGARTRTGSNLKQKNWLEFWQKILKISKKIVKFLFQLFIYLLL